MFNNLTVQQNIDFIYNNRSSQLNHVTTSNGPLTFVGKNRSIDLLQYCDIHSFDENNGEWVSEWQVSGATKEDYQQFSRAQLEVYGRATFGWAYWTLRNVNRHWSLEWMIKNGYMKL
ncbi:hypothetical protein CRYUN_Cryun28dG0051500 [Craigia yunnanensis]